MKKYMAETIGTMILVLMGCGSAVFNGGCGTPRPSIDGSDGIWPFGSGDGLHYRWDFGLSY